MQSVCTEEAESRFTPVLNEDPGFSVCANPTSYCLCVMEAGPPRTKFLLSPKTALLKTCKALQSEQNEQHYSSGLLTT